MLPLIIHLSSAALLCTILYSLLPESFYARGFFSSLELMSVQFWWLYLLPALPFSLAAMALPIKPPPSGTIATLSSLALIISLVGIFITYRELNYIPLFFNGDKEAARQHFGIFGVGLIASFWTYGICIAAVSLPGATKWGWLRFILLCTIAVMILQRLYLSIALVAAFLSFLLASSKHKFRFTATFGVLVPGMFIILLCIRTNGNLAHLANAHEEPVYKTLLGQFSAYYGSAAANTLHFIQTNGCDTANTYGSNTLGAFYTFFFKHTVGWFADPATIQRRFISTLNVPIYNTGMRIADYCMDFTWNFAWIGSLIDSIIFAILYIFTHASLRYVNFCLWCALIAFFPMGHYYIIPNFLASFLCLNAVAWLISALQFHRWPNNWSKSAIRF